MDINILLKVAGFAAVNAVEGNADPALFRKREL